VKRSELYAIRRYSDGTEVRVAGVSEGEARRKSVKSVVSEVEESVSICVESRNRTRNSGPSGLRWSTNCERGIESSIASVSFSMICRSTSKKVISDARSSLRNSGRELPCAEVQMTSEGSGVKRNRRMTNEVSRR